MPCKLVSLQITFRDHLPHGSKWATGIEFVVILPALLIVSAFSLSPPAWSQTFPVTYPTLGRILKEDSRLDHLIPSNAKIEVLASGMKFAEGPVWVRDGGYLLFSDVPRNSVMKWKEGEGLNLFMKPSGYTEW